MKIKTEKYISKKSTINENVFKEKIKKVKRLESILHIGLDFFIKDYFYSFKMNLESLNN